MKFPKNRANVYIVMRDQSLLGVFANYEDAEDYRGACEQEWLDKVKDAPHVFFFITTTTFYG